GPSGAVSPSGVRAVAGHRPAAGMAGGDAAGKPLDPRIARRDLLGIAQVEHGGAARRPVLLLVIGAENAVPGIVGDAVVAVLVEIVVLVVALLHELHPLPPRLEREMLDAVHELVIAGVEDAGGKS